METNDDPEKYTTLIKRCTSVSHTPLLDVVLYLPGGESQTVGYVTSEVAEFEHWPKFFFEQEKDHAGNIVRLAIDKDQLLQLDWKNVIGDFCGGFRFLDNYKDEKPKLVRLLGVPGKIEIATGITYVMGAVRHEVHLIPYAIGPNKDMKVLVGGGKFSNLSYNKRFNYTLSASVLSGEEAKDTCNKLLLEKDLDGKTLQGCHRKGKLSAHSQVAYCTIDEKGAYGFHKVVDAAIISCYSVEMTDGWRPWFASKACKESTVKGIKNDLLENKYEPGSALSTIRFLLDKGYISKSCGRQIEGLLCPEIPHDGVTPSVTDKAE